MEPSQEWNDLALRVSVKISVLVVGNDPVRGERMRLCRPYILMALVSNRFKEAGARALHVVGSWLIDAQGVLLVDEIMPRDGCQVSHIRWGGLHVLWHDPTLWGGNFSFRACLWIDQEMTCGEDLGDGDGLDVRVVMVNVNVPSDFFLDDIHSVGVDGFVGDSRVENFINIGMMCGMNCARLRGWSYVCTVQYPSRVF